MISFGNSNNIGTHTNNQSTDGVISLTYHP